MVYAVVFVIRNYTSFSYAVHGRSNEVKQLICEGEYIVCMKSSYSGKLFATCSSNKILKIWDTSSWTCLGSRCVLTYI